MGKAKLNKKCQLSRYNNSFAVKRDTPLVYTKLNRLIRPIMPSYVTKYQVSAITKFFKKDLGVDFVISSVIIATFH